MWFVSKSHYILMHVTVCVYMYIVTWHSVVFERACQGDGVIIDDVMWYTCDNAANIRVKGDEIMINDVMNRCGFSSCCKGWRKKQCFHPLIAFILLVLSLIFHLIPLSYGLKKKKWSCGLSTPVPAYPPDRLVRSQGAWQALLKGLNRQSLRSSHGIRWCRSGRGID